ncbi:hypothetical protein DFAR_990006 [Desulfarculales bacterium]
MKPLQRFGFNFSSALPAGRWIRLRPRGSWSRFQAPVETIRQSLSNKLSRGRWDPGLPQPSPAPSSKACGKPSPSPSSPSPPGRW